MHATLLLSTHAFDSYPENGIDTNSGIADSLENMINCSDLSNNTSTSETRIRKQVVLRTDTNRHQTDSFDVVGKVRF